MKQSLFTFILIYSLTSFSQIKSGKITYVFSMTPISQKKIDSITKKRATKNARMREWFKNTLKNTPNVNAYLEFSNGESIYYVENEMQIEGKPIFNMNRISAGGDNKVYVNAKTKEILKEYNTENLLIVKKPKKWKITQESKKIGNYLCFKAIDIESKNKKMKPIVWFTPEIPVSFGPLDFHGLPGLVILVEMYNRTISVSKVVLNPKEKIVLKELNKGERISEEKFNKKMSELWNSIKKM